MSQHPRLVPCTEGYTIPSSTPKTQNPPPKTSNTPPTPPVTPKNDKK